MSLHYKSLMKNVFIPVLAFFVFSCSKVIYVEDISGLRMSKINTKENKDKILVVDVRSNSEYKKGHLNYAINIPLEEIGERFSEIKDKKQKPVYLYGENDNLSFKAAELLVKNGFEKIFNAEGTGQYKYEFIYYDVIRANEIKKYQRTRNAFIVDYRTKQAYLDKHFEGAVNVPIGSINENKDIFPEDKNQMVIFYCNTGISSVWGAEELTGMGYKNVAAVLEGILEEDFQKAMEDK